MTTEQREAMRRIFREVGAYHGFTEADLYVRDRRAELVAVRNEAWVKCREAGFSYPVIGALAGWHHTTVMNGVERHRGQA